MKAWSRAVAVALGLLLGGCQGAVSQTADVPTFEVAPRATFVREVKAEGTLEAVEATAVTAPADAERPMMVAWIAEDGTRVAKGDVILRFDDSEAQRVRADSTDDVSSAQRKIRKVGVVGDATSKKRTATADLAGLETKVAREFVSEDDDIFSRNEIIESTIDVGLAEAKAGHSKTVAGVERSVSTHELRLHRIEKEHAEREVERADEALAKLEVVAPHDGLVVLSRNWRGQTTRVGDSVWRGQKIAEIPHVANLQVALFVLEADAGSLEAGLPAEVEIAAHPGTQYAAKVERVDTLAKPRHPEVPVHYFGVTLALDKTDPETMRIGQRVTASIRMEDPDAIVVPRQAIFDREGQTVVYRKDGDAFEPVVVTLGAASVGRVAIGDAIESGDVVALRDPTRSADDALAGNNDAKEQKSAPGGAG